MGRAVVRDASNWGCDRVRARRNSVQLLRWLDRTPDSRTQRCVRDPPRPLQRQNQRSRNQSPFQTEKQARAQSSRSWHRQFTTENAANSFDRSISSRGHRNSSGTIRINHAMITIFKPDTHVIDPPPGRHYRIWVTARTRIHIACNWEQHENSCGRTQWRGEVDSVEASGRLY